MTRSERVQEARRLWADGMLQREIADRFGVATKTVNTWLNDPDLSRQRARRRSYSRPCMDCGKPTDGSGGRVSGHKRCDACAREFEHQARRWTPERVIAALQEWAADLGRAPTAIEALQAGARVSCPVVQREFGSWNAGIAAAGFEPRGFGDRLTYRTRHSVTSSASPSPVSRPKPTTAPTPQHCPNPYHVPIPSMPAVDLAPNHPTR